MRLSESTKQRADARRSPVAADLTRCNGYTSVDGFLLPPSSIMKRTGRRICLLAIFSLLLGRLALSQESGDEDRFSIAAVVDRYCIDCHQGGQAQGDVDLSTLDTTTDASAMGSTSTEVLERMVRVLRLGRMPPQASDRPEPQVYRSLVTILSEQLDANATAMPKPGRTASFRRLTRIEYQRSIRDLLGIEVDVQSLLPADELSHGFDNITVTDLSPLWMERALEAAEKVSRLAVGSGPSSLEERIVRVPADLTQDVAIEGMPLGTRGGTRFVHHFPATGRYEIQLRLMRDRNDEVEALHGQHSLVALIDRGLIATFPIQRPTDGSSDRSVDDRLVHRFDMEAGPHEVAVTFRSQSLPLQETRRQPLHVHFNFYRHPRLGPALYEVAIRGPVEPSQAHYRADGMQRPDAGKDELAQSHAILDRWMRRAWRQQPTELQRQRIYEQCARGRSEGGTFESGVQRGLMGILANPLFLFRIERQPEGLAKGTAYALSDFELATRMSFFLWRSLPDERLLDLAESKRLSDPEVLRGEVKRMLADGRSDALVSHFASQWLHLENLQSTSPDMRRYPDFDDNLRQAMRRETLLQFQRVLDEHRSIVELIDSNETYLNQRLAEHYRIPHVYGSHFRRVKLPENAMRGGLLRNASILTVTSLATRTSPVLRGKWVLENVLGFSPPPPPPDIPDLEDVSVSASLPVRDRLAVHRSNAACASCHDSIDPAGLALESYDAIGRWRTRDAGVRIDRHGGLLDGQILIGVEGIESSLAAHPEWLAHTLTEKLMTYALGRLIVADDGPAVRAIVNQSQPGGYRLTDLIEGIVCSVPFRMREAE
jgi:hypothetical protein